MPSRVCTLVPHDAHSVLAVEETHNDAFTSSYLGYSCGTTQSAGSSLHQRCHKEGYLDPRHYLLSGIFHCVDSSEGLMGELERTFQCHQTQRCDPQSISVVRYSFQIRG